MFKSDINDESGRSTLWTIPVLGGSARRLGNHLARGASWSPDGRSLVYADLNSVFVSDANGSNSREIWNANRLVSGWPRFSPDSKQIRVTVDGKNSSDPMRIFEMNADGSNVHPLPLAAVVTENVQTADRDQVMSVIPSGGAEVTPGQTYRLKLSARTTFGWKYVVGGYEKGAATLNGKPLLPNARSTLLFRTFGPK